MTVYDKMVIDLLLSAKTAGSEIHIVVAQWASKYGVEQRYAREKLVQLHQDKIIRLSAFHESKGVQPLEAWPDSDYFFDYASDGNHKRVTLLLKGAELLEKLAAIPTPIQGQEVSRGEFGEVAEISTSEQQGRGAEADRKFASLAIAEARKSVAEDGRPHPKVGAVVVKDGKVLSTAYRGEHLGNHAEYVALEKKLRNEDVTGATVYTTLEPCTTRTHPKIPCAERLVERKVARVVIGMLDPNPDIRGRGDQILSDAGIEIQLFPRELRAQVEDMNREFIRSQKDRQAQAKVRTADEDQSSWPDVILECQWPSLLREPKIPGSHIRKRPWILRYRGPGAVYDVRVHRIRFGAYEAVFPFPVSTLTDTASVYPIVCRKSDGKSDALMIDADLESLIRNPPSGCDVWRYAVETCGVEEAEDEEDEEIRPDDSLPEVEIPVTISYDDKNGNRFKIKYLLHYESCIEKGEMIRIGGIEKVAPN